MGYASARYLKDSWIAFAVKQIQLSAIGLVSVWCLDGGAIGLLRWLEALARDRDLYLFLCAYIAAVFGGGLFVQRVAESLLASISSSAKELKPGLPNAGKYIGWIERFLILTFVVGGYGEAVGFLLAAKALARYPEIKEDKQGHFAEYFLVGTFTSVGFALLIGLVVVRIRLTW